MAKTAVIQTPLSPLNEDSSSTLPQIDFLNPESCQSLCSQRRLKLQQDEDALIEARDQILRAQKETVRLGLCTMSKDLKKMTVKEFNEAFGCDLIDTIRSKLEDVEQAGKKQRVGVKGAGGLSLKTPAVKFTGRQPMTRTVRKGERVVSVNGSPVDQFDQGELVVTAKKRRAVDTTAKKSTRFPISIGVGAGNGETIDLSDPDQRGRLDEEEKAQAKEQIMAMQEQMKNLMANW